MTAQTDLPTGQDLLAEINRLRKEKNAIILAHYYQTSDIQDIADFVGDAAPQIVVYIDDRHLGPGTGV